MNSCLLCHRENLRQPSLWQLMNFQPLPTSPLCQTCWQDFESIPAEEACSGCGRHCQTKICEDCERWSKTVIFSNRALYAYNAPLRRFMSQYKFNGDYRLRLAFQHQFEIAVKEIHADLVIPIPINETTYSNRGFNQVEGFLEKVVLTPGLKTLRQTKQIPQSAKNRQERMMTDQPFALALNANVFCKKRILVVDDIYTTGRTIRHAANLLLNAGASEVVGLTLAHG